MPGLHGNPYDGHTLAHRAEKWIRFSASNDTLAAAVVVVPAITHVDKYYRGQNHPNRFQVWISGQVHRTTAALRREMKRRAAIEHLKTDHRMGRNHLKGRDGDRINVVLAAVGSTSHSCCCWIRSIASTGVTQATKQCFTDDYSII